MRPGCRHCACTTGEERKVLERSLGEQSVTEGGCWKPGESSVNPGRQRSPGARAAKKLIRRKTWREGECGGGRVGYGGCNGS